MEMTSKERILAAMNLQRPDRVPLMCQFSIGCMMEQLHPGEAGEVCPEEISIAT